MRISISILFLFIGVLGYAQNRVSIQDPDLTFSYILPEDWTNIDDPYYHYILPPKSKKCDSVAVALTYFEGKCADLDECFDGEVKGAFPNEYPGFKIENSGKDRIQDIDSKWIEFSYHTEESSEKKIALYYSFISHNQLFTIFFGAQKDCFAKNEAAVFKLIQSLEIEANQ